MQKKKLISIAIAIALQSYYIPAIAAENNDDEKECPSNISSLPKEKRAKLSPACLATLTEKDNHWGWVAGGVAALVAGVAIGVENNDGGDSTHSYIPPTPDDGGDVTPPDDGGDVTPPDDGGDVTPPDDGGDVTPPDDGGDVTPPDDGGDVTPPDDGGDVTPPDDGGDVTPPDDGGDVTPPDDGGDVTPPDDGGDVTPPDDGGDTSVTTFSNGVTLDRGADTLHFDDIKLDNGDHLGEATLSYAEKDGQWQLTTADGKMLNVSGWNITDANAAVIEGTQENGLYWKYDSKGYLILANDQTAVVTGDDKTHQSDRDAQISGENNTSVIISGDRTNNTLSGDSTVTDSATGIVITGDNTTNTISGKSTVDGGTGALISGDGTNTTLAGDITVSGGGTAIILDGDNITVDNSGISNISGDGSTGAIITGDNAHVSNEGALTITDGGTGSKITGDGAMVDNQGNTTTSGEGSTSLYIDGNNALVINEGDQAISNGAAGTKIDGDNTRMINTGDLNVDGAGSAGVAINGDNTNLTQRGDLLVTNGAVGIATTGKGNKVTNAGKTTVRDADSVGFEVTGEQNTFNNTGDIDVSLNGTGAKINGTASQTNLDGNINVTAVQDGDGVYRGATGLDISGDSNITDITGSVSIKGAYSRNDILAGDTDTLKGVTISGNDNQVSLAGTLSIDVSDSTSVNGQYLETIGLDVQGDGNTVNLDGGINIKYAEEISDYSSLAVGININGDSTVTLNGTSTLDLITVAGGNAILADVQNGGHLTLGEDSIINIKRAYVGESYYTDTALLMSIGQGSVIENKGTIISDGASSVLLADDGALAGNSGDITVYTQPYFNRDAIATALGEGSSVHNEAGGSITLVSTQTPTYSTGRVKYPVIWYTKTYYGMLAYDYGEIVNDAEATLTLQGAGTYGMAATKGTATNAGDIYLDGFIPTINDEGAITAKTYWHPSSLYLTSSAMVAGSTDSGYGNGTTTNTGNITVNNAGFGMMALNGGTAINQGTITLTADEGVTGTDSNQLVGMVALNGGIVINDAAGTININADYAKPFYSDSSSFVVNYGTVCIGNECQDSPEYNPTDNSVSVAVKDGDVITTEGETLTGKNIVIDPIATQTVHATNAGTISGGKVNVKNYGDVTNKSTGSISNVAIATGGIYTNEGTTGTVSVDGGVFNNNGTVTGKTETTVAGSIINNSGSMNSVTQWASTMSNSGTVTSWTGASGSAVLNNSVDGEVDALDFTAAATVNNSGVIKNGSVDKNGTLNNLEGGVITLKNNGLWSGKFNNWGTVNSDANIATGGSGHTLYNGTTGVINGQITTSKNNGGSKAINDGTINIDKTNNVAMSAHGSAKMVNNGTINVGAEGTTQTGMVGMQLESDAKADAVIENNGTINIYASNSYAFSQLGSNGHIVNNGTIVIDDSVTGSGFIKQDGKTIEGSGENGDGTEVHYVDFTAPTEPSTNSATMAVTGGDSTSTGTNDLRGYVVGTSADGSAGQLKVSNASMNGVGINTGFTAGTADTTVTFDNVVEGSNLTDASAIQSTSVVWNAQGSQDADGNVDVTMTKNAYADVATDSSVSDVAGALDAGYTNNELYTSLNVGTTAELNSALKQVSGSQATTVFREARVLSNRFNMLADAAPEIKDGLAFNLVAKGDPRAELGNDTQYDMLALRQKLSLTESQELTMEYGIARLDGDGSKKAGDNGLTGGYSQFLGLKHSMAFEDGLAWNNSLRYDVHNLDSSRSVAYGDVSKVADSDIRQQYMEFRSEGTKTFSVMDDALKITPYAGVKFRHTLEGGYKERSAGDFNLSMNSGSETAVDSIVGLKFDYNGENGWSANATLEGGPNLSYAKSQRTASLQGAASQSFGIDDGQKGGGVNGLATIGVKYSSNDSTLHLNAYQWKEDGISDKGFMLNFKKTFR
ncbi:autotransporter adhesin BigA [Citrobacter werkmanii]